MRNELRLHSGLTLRVGVVIVLLIMVFKIIVVFFKTHTQYNMEHIILAKISGENDLS